jgi:hypothetical protein
VPFSPEATFRVKMLRSDEYFEAKTIVIHVHPTPGMRLAFRDRKPDFRIVKQERLLAALNRERRLVSGTAQTSSCEPG